MHTKHGCFIDLDARNVRFALGKPGADDNSSVTTLELKTGLSRALDNFSKPDTLYIDGKQAIDRMEIVYIQG
jgi:hypothetical protein